MLHRRLSHARRHMHNGSHLLYVAKPASQQQATVKFHGVFASHWRSLAFAPEWIVQELGARDSSDLITPFMHVVIQTTRHYAQLVTLDQSFLLASQHRCCVRTVSSSLRMSGVQSLRILVLSLSCMVICTQHIVTFSVMWDSQTFQHMVGFLFHIIGVASVFLFNSGT